MPIKGRTMNLQSGRIEKSDVTINPTVVEQKPTSSPLPTDETPVMENDTLAITDVDTLIQPMQPAAEETQ